LRNSRAVMLCGKELVNRFVGADMRLFCMHLTHNESSLSHERFYL